jgi:hypothetical protein
MKKQILRLAFICFAIILSFQSKAGDTIVMGVKAGFNISNFRSPQFKASPRIGLEAAIIATERFGKNFNLIVEFNYSQLGAKAKGRTLSDTVFSDYVVQNLFYNSVGMEAIIDFHLKSQKFSIQGGGVLNGLNWTPKKQLKDPNCFFGNSNNLDNLISSRLLFDNIKMHPNYSLIFGVSAGNKALRASLRYYLGLWNFYKKASMTSDFGAEIKNNAIQLSVSYTVQHIKFVIY